MTRNRISSGSKFEAEIGYSRAIVDGDWIWVSGTTGFNYETMTISEDVAEQAEQTLQNIKAALDQAGFSLRGRCARQLHPAEGRGFSGLLAGASQVFRRDPPGLDHDHRRPRRPAHEDRNRGHGQKALHASLDRGWGLLYHAPH